MVYIELNGRVGNHLFQIATGASYAKKHKQDFVVVCHDGYKLAEPDNCYIREYIEQFKSNILKNIQIEYKRPKDALYYYEPYFEYKEIPYWGEGKDVLLYGAFQSYKYFDENLTRVLFEIPTDIKDYISQKYQHILDMGVTSINVRRGDYCKLPHRYPICTMSFYKKAIEYIGKNEKFLIISDDIEWCKQEFIGENFYFVDDEEPIIDLYLQTLCKNNIISNSSFSWWGAWLNNNPQKKVVCPTPWFGRSYNDKSTKDLLPENWVQLENKLPFKMETKAIVLNVVDQIHYKLSKTYHKFKRLAKK